MCIVCIEMAKNNLKPMEAFNALREMIISTDDNKKIQHYIEVADKIEQELGTDDEFE